jgi:hypothetical protein
LTAKTLLFHVKQFFGDDGIEIGDKHLMDSSLWSDHYLHPLTQRYLEVLENSLLMHDALQIVANLYT